MLKQMSRREWAGRVGAGLLATTTGGVAGRATAAGLTRDAAYWPFASNDPWNTSIGAGAIYKTINSPGFSVNGGAFFNITEWTIPIYVATSTDPYRRVYVSGSSVPSFTIRVPNAAKPDPQGDGHLLIVDPTHTYVVEMYQAVRQPNMDLVANDCLQNNIRGAGFYPYWHGERAYGGSAMGGLIRKGELIHGIPHAITLVVQRAAYNQFGPGGNPFVWPASSADDGYQTTYGTSGNLFMGSLLAIPATTDITKLGVGSSGPGYQIAKALQDYGGYLVDSSSDNMTFQVEPSAAGDCPANIDDQASLIIKALKVVTNNTPTTIGGGGTRRRPTAPPFA